MLKKLIRSVALILALVTVFMVPVSADDSNSLWVNFLDYDTGHETGNTLTFTGSGSLSYDLPYSTYFRYVQGLIQSSGGAIDRVTVSFGFSSTEFDLTLLDIGNGLYRFYSSSLSRINTSATLHFYSDSTSSTYLEVLSFEYSSLRSVQYSEIGSITASGGGLTTTKTVSMTNSSTYAHLEFLDGLSEAEFGYSALFYCLDWRNYDFLDYYIEIRTLEFDSFSAFCGTKAIPIETSDFYYALNGQVRVMVRLDLRDINRSSTDVPYLRLTGTSTPAGGNDLYLLSVSGVVTFDEPDSMLFYFSSLESKLSSLFDDMAQRQDAYHSDLEDWNIENQQNLGALFDSVTNPLSDISADIKSIHSTLLVEFDSLIDKLTSVQNGIVSKLNTFQTTVVSWFSTISGKLDQLIGGTTEGDELSQGAADLEDQVGDIQDYEHSQQEILDNSLPEIQQAVNFTSFTAALAFVQRYINLGWSGIGDLSIIYTLPIFIGLFFFICGRLPGVTRWSSRPPKGGGSK